MKAIQVKQPGGPETLVLGDLSIPLLKEDELLIKVEAAGVNRTDILSRQQKNDSGKPAQLGVEVSGTVADANGHDDFSEGDRVMGLVNGGGYAEYGVMPDNRAMPVPESLSYVEAAAIPEVFLTAYQTLFWIGRLKENETVLIHAGASGVGTAAIQLAKELCHARVIVTAGSQRKLDFCRDLGADVMINYKEQDFAEEVLKATDGKGVDLILDFIGASYWEKNLKSIKTDGRWVLIGALGGATVNTVNLFALMQKRIQLTGTLLTPRSNLYKAELTSDLIKDTLSLFENGKIKPIVDTTFSLQDAGNAHRHMENNKNVGKIILTIE